MSKVEITAQGRIAKVEIDGLDVSNICTGYVVMTQNAGKRPEITVTLEPDELLFHGDDVTVKALHQILTPEPPNVDVAARNRFALVAKVSSRPKP